MSYFVIDGLVLLTRSYVLPVVFTRATLCYSAGICYGISVCVCLCVCVTHRQTRVLCIKTAKLFVAILLLSDSSIILVFRHWGSLLNSDGFISNEGAEYNGGWEIGRFLTNKSVYQKLYRSRIGNHAQAIEWEHFRWPLVTQPSLSSLKANISQTWRRAGFSAIAELGLVLSYQS